MNNIAKHNPPVRLAKEDMLTLEQIAPGMPVVLLRAGFDPTTTWITNFTGIVSSIDHEAGKVSFRPNIGVMHKIRFTTVGLTPMYDGTQPALGLIPVELKDKYFAHAEKTTFPGKEIHLRTLELTSAVAL